MLPKKSLGQNFLRAPAIIEAIVEAGEVGSSDIILEIGPGEGVLTTSLLEKAQKVIAVEKDDRLAPILREKFNKEITEGKLELIHDDALRIEPERYGLTKGGYKLIANIPYYITGEILRKFHETAQSPSLMVLMVQKEVAERIAKDPKESILSLSVKVYGTPSYIRTVKAGSFYPAPNVDSAILKVSNISKDFFTTNHIEEPRFFEIIKAAFAHKRKFLTKNLEAVLPRDLIEKVFTELTLSPKSRAEELDMATWKKLVPLLINSLSTRY